MIINEIAESIVSEVDSSSMEAGRLSKECSCSYTLPEVQHHRFKRPFARSQESQRTPLSFKRRVPTDHHDHRKEKVFASAADLSADYSQGDEEAPQLNEVFPRIKEGNPYRCTLASDWIL